jgi:BRCA1-associated RING domain protein 1
MSTTATHVSIMVKTFGEMDSGTVNVPNRGEMQRYVLEQGQMQSQVLQRAQMQSNVLKRRQMQSDELIKQFNSPTKPSLAGVRKVLKIILFYFGL